MYQKGYTLAQIADVSEKTIKEVESILKDKNSLPAWTAFLVENSPPTTSRAEKATSHAKAIDKEMENVVYSILIRSEKPVSVLRLAFSIGQIL